MTSASGAFGLRKHVGPYACTDETIALRGFDANVVVCARSHRLLTGLYDFTVRVSSLDGAARGFTSHLDLWGIEFDGAQRFIRRYLEAMESKPQPSMPRPPTSVSSKQGTRGPRL